MVFLDFPCDTLGCYNISIIIDDNLIIVAFGVDVSSNELEYTNIVVPSVHTWHTHFANRLSQGV